MTAQQPDLSLASTQEVVLALHQLSPPDLLRLRQIAGMRAIGLPSMDWEDLLHEAIARLLAGARPWPKAVPFVAFVAQIIRSVAGDEWRRIGRLPVVPESQMDTGVSDEPGGALAGIAVQHISPERELIAQATLEEIRALFADDAHAHQILVGMALGLDPSEIQNNSGMSATQYATAQRRIRRQVARFLSGKDKT
jgi:DNA-directed RNA polymerase specialized sigma24 family protein